MVILCWYPWWRAWRELLGCWFGWRCEGGGWILTVSSAVCRGGVEVGADGCGFVKGKISEILFSLWLWFGKKGCCVFCFDGMASGSLLQQLQQLNTILRY
ncbi:MAG: hypothetical protein IPQ25_12350 [Chitinophagaceae bacterium]|nr:hypothetical protein [Chitinophagaceae bacterium]